MEGNSFGFLRRTGEGSPGICETRSGRNRKLSRPRTARVMETPARSAVGESLELAQRTLGRILAGVALASTLTLAGPAPAHAAPRMPSLSVLSWMDSLLGERIAALWMAVGGGDHKRGASLEKAGPAVDPNGGTGSGQSTGTSTTNGQSLWIDPNG